MAALDGRSDWFAPATQRDRLRARRTRRAQPRGARRARPIPLAGGVEAGCRAHRLPDHDGVRADEPAHRHAARASTASWATAPASPAPTRSSTSCAAGTPTVCPIEWQRRDAADRRRVRASPSRSPSTPAPASRAATLRGAEFHAADDLRAGRARRGPRRAASGIVRVSSTPRSSTRIGHRRGWQSDEWVAALERVDAAARTLDGATRPAAPASSSRPTTAWSTCRATGTCC